VISNSTNVQRTTQIPGFSSEAKWESLTQEEQSISAPKNPFNSTDPSGNDNNNRYNLKETFAIPKFTLTSKAYHRVGRN